MSHPNKWRIQDFPEGGVPTPKLGLFCKFFAENCMKMKEFGPRRGASLMPALDPPVRIHPSPPAPIDCSYRYVLFMFLGLHPPPPRLNLRGFWILYCIQCKEFSLFWKLFLHNVKVRLHLASECEGDGIIDVAFWWVLRKSNRIVVMIKKRFSLSFSLLRSVNGSLQCQSVYNNVKYADRVKTFARWCGAWRALTVTLSVFTNDGTVTLT